MVLGLFVVARPTLGTELDYLALMPTTDTVRAKVTGTDPLDTAARVHGAFEILRDVVKDLAGARVVSNQLTPAELALLVEYQKGQALATQQGKALIAKAGAPAAGPESVSPKWSRLSRHYQYEPQHRQFVLGTLLPPSVQAQFRQASQKAAESQKPAGSTATEDSTESLIGHAREVVMTLVNEPLLAAALGVLLLLAASYPLLAMVLSWRVSLAAVSGNVTRQTRWFETETHTTGGNYSAVTGQTSSTHTTVTQVRLERYWVNTGAGEGWFTLRDSPLQIKDGQRVSAVNASRGSNAKSGWTCHVRNHDTGESLDALDGCRRARVGSVRASMFWTLFLGLPGLVGFSVLGGLRGDLTSALLGYLVVWFVFSWVGALPIGLFHHLIGDRRIMSRARSLARAA